VKYGVDPVLGEQSRNSGAIAVVENVKSCSARYSGSVSSREVVDDNDCMTSLQQPPAANRSNVSGSAGYKNAAHDQ
jgi:hypothetical protein